MTFLSELKEKTASAGDNYLTWILSKKQKVIGYSAVNRTTNPTKVALQVSDNPLDYTARNVDVGLCLSDTGYAKIFPKAIEVKNVRIWFEDCVVSDSIMGRLFYE